MATEIWVNIGSGNGLLPDGTKPLPEPMLVKSSDINILFENYMSKISFKCPRGQWVKLLGKSPGHDVNHWRKTIVVPQQVCLIELESGIR